MLIISVLYSKCLGCVIYRGCSIEDYEEHRIPLSPPLSSRTSFDNSCPGSNVSEGRGPFLNHLIVRFIQNIFFFFYLDFLWLEGIRYSDIISQTSNQMTKRVNFHVVFNVVVQHRQTSCPGKRHLIGTCDISRCT